jgi:hypothetical protein
MNAVCYWVRHHMQWIQCVIASKQWMQCVTESNITCNEFNVLLLQSNECSVLLSQTSHAMKSMCYCFKAMNAACYWVRHHMQWIQCVTTSKQWMQCYWVKDHKQWILSQCLRKNIAHVSVTTAMPIAMRPAMTIYKHYCNKNTINFAHSALFIYHAQKPLTFIATYDVVLFLPYLQIYFPCKHLSYVLNC